MHSGIKLAAAWLGRSVFFAIPLLASATHAQGLKPIDPPFEAELTGRALDGAYLDLEQRRGQVVLIHFWASWCAPCLREMPQIQSLMAIDGNRPIGLIGVDVGEPERRAAHWVKRLGIEFPVLLDEHSEQFTRWSASVLPTTFVVDRTGKAVYVGQGPQDWTDPDVRALLLTLTEAP